MLTIFIALGKTLFLTPEGLDGSMAAGRRSADLAACRHAVCTTNVQFL
jgi:hypothetical protein